MTRFNAATERQIAASNPVESVWLSANAGSGKTKVLTDRVARLLLAGTEPQKVLCLTYTKAAATEMQNRLLKRLGGWAMLPEAKLRDELGQLGLDTDLTDERLAEARRLFAKAIETPGGLRIQTIHSFCASLLRRFPLEAGVPHGFTEMDERAGVLLQQDIVEEIAAGPERTVLDSVARFLSGDKLTPLIKDILKYRTGFSEPLAFGDILRRLGEDPQLTPDAFVERTLKQRDIEMLHALARLMATSSSNDVRAAAKLLAVQRPSMDAIGALETVLLFGENTKNPFGPKIGSLPTKPIAEGPGAKFIPELHELMERIADARQTRLHLLLAERTLALHTFAQCFLPRFEAQKRARGWLNFDDLIERAGALLSNPSVAQWVLYRLDGGIDHILVDEAQDTSPGQWQVIEKLADEFTAGETAHEAPRTIFVVGDRKQSIYSFQGADLVRFQAMQSHFSTKFGAINRPLKIREMEHSFRSSAAVLDMVDQSFAGPAQGGLGGAPEHVAFHDMPGRVDLWPVIEGVKQPDDENWENPVDLVSPGEANSILAHTIAAEISAMIERGVQIESKDGPRPIHEGDILILVRRRSALFTEIIRACKMRGLAIAGADRLKLSAELAVKDIRSTLAFLATPEDDLSLAEALRSPLFGWNEQELFSLAQPREGYLWEALRKTENHPETVSILQDLRDNADFLRPFELIERLLTRHRGRERLIARLGHEAEDGIDELISQAMTFEQSETPSLTGFLGWLSTDDVVVKRQAESQGRSIRVMTVHGAKGLEAPIVILPETQIRTDRADKPVYLLDDGLPVWKPTKGHIPDALNAVLGDAKCDTEDESMHLLYVAMTRAEKWLIVAGAGTVGTGTDSWYSIVQEALNSAEIETVSGYSDALVELGPVKRFAVGSWPADDPTRHAPGTVDEVPLPAWISAPAPPPVDETPVLSPSQLGGAKAMPGDYSLIDTEAALARGSALHALLEHLPQFPRDTWQEVAQSVLQAGDGAQTQDALDALLSEATRVLDHPEMAPFLQPQSLAEAEITVELDELGGRIHGAIDRLLVEADHIRILDFKSNAIVPETAAQTPLGITRQMAAYRAALRRIYPDRPISCFIFWTVTGTMMELPTAQLDASLCTDTAS